MKSEHLAIDQCPKCHREDCQCVRIERQKWTLPTELETQVAVDLDEEIYGRRG